MESVLVPTAHSLPQLRAAHCCRDPGHQGHTALSGNYSSGQLSLAFLSSESCIFLPIFGGDLVAGQPSRASLQPGPASRRGRLPAPSELEGRPSGLDAELPGKGAKAVFPFSPQEKNSFSDVFVVGEYFCHCFEKTSSPNFPLSWEFPPLNRKPPLFTRNPCFSFLP